MSRMRGSHTTGPSIFQLRIPASIFCSSNMQTHAISDCTNRSLLSIFLTSRLNSCRRVTEKMRIAMLRWVCAASERRWGVLTFAAVVLPAFVDYQWSGVAFVLLAWFGFRTGRALAALAGFVPLCLFNGNLWALAALPVVVAMSGCAGSCRIAAGLLLCALALPSVAQQFYKCH